MSNDRNALKKLEKLRIRKLILYFFTLLIFSLFVMIGSFVNNKWLYFLIWFNNCLLLILNFLLIELKISHKIRIMYTDFLKQIINKIDERFEYERLNGPYEPFNHQFRPLDASSKIECRVNIDLNSQKYELLNVKLNLNTHRKHKIRIFKGLILTVKKDYDVHN